MRETNDRGINQRLADGLDIESIIISRSPDPTLVQTIAEITGFSARKVRRIVRTLEAKNRVVPSAGGWTIANASLAMMASTCRGAGPV